MIAQKKRLLIACGEGTMLELIEVQVEGRKRMSAEAFLNGQHLKRQRNAGGEGGVKLPLGYRYSAVYAGIRKVKKDDLALIVSDVPASGAAVFTQNRVQAAPVRIARWNLTQVARIGERGADQCGQRELRHPDRRPRRAGLLRCRCQSAARAADAGFSGVHRRDRRGTGCASDRERAARPGRGLGARSIRRRRARHPDHRSGDEDRASARCASRKAPSRSRG